MREGDLNRLIQGTRDAAFVVDSQCVMAGWNEAAEKLFGISAADAVGQLCHGIVQGVDESGQVCSKNCTVQQAMQERRPLENFDMQVRTAGGRKWCNVSMMIAETGSSVAVHAIHIMRPVDVTKRLELVVRDFVLTHTSLSPKEGIALMAESTAARQTDLSARELEVLSLLAAGESTKTVALQLQISTATVNNHVQHILHKLDVHNRIGAIRRAERSGLL